MSVIDVNVGVVRCCQVALADFEYDDVSSRMQMIVHRDSADIRDPRFEHSMT